MTMTFDNDAIRKLTEIFRKKVDEMEVNLCWREDFADLMAYLGIRQVESGDWHCRDIGETIIGDGDRFRGCVLVFDPSVGTIGNRYLLIPKELAEKMSKTKGMSVKNLRNAIIMGLNIREAAYVGLKAVKDLDILKQGGEEPDLDWMERFIRHLFEKNDHAIIFKAKDDRDGRGTWVLDLEPDGWADDLSLSYTTFNIDYPESSAEEDEYLLNKFILDFYGINQARRIKEIQDEIASLEEELKHGRDRLKKLKLELSHKT